MRKCPQETNEELRAADNFQTSESLQTGKGESSMDRGPWRATVHEVTKSQTQMKQLSTHAHRSEPTTLLLGIFETFKQLRELSN